MENETFRLKRLKLETIAEQNWIKNKNEIQIVGKIYCYGLKIKETASCFIFLDIIANKKRFVF